MLANKTFPRDRETLTARPQFTKKHWKGRTSLLRVKSAAEFSVLEAKQTNKEIKQHLSWQKWGSWGQVMCHVPLSTLSSPTKKRSQPRVLRTLCVALVLFSSSKDGFLWASRLKECFILVSLILFLVGSLNDFWQRTLQPCWAAR